MDKDHYQTYLVTAGGSITCLRCTAKSKRSGQQCRRPALKASRTFKCQFHGGRDSGPKTDAGRACIGAAHRIHGNETLAARAERSQCSAKLSQLEDAMLILGIPVAPLQRGRKALGYRRLRTVDDVRQMVVGQVRGSSDQGLVKKPQTA
jgi:hypothetical protein